MMLLWMKARASNKQRRDAATDVATEEHRQGGFLLRAAEGGAVCLCQSVCVWVCVCSCMELYGVSAGVAGCQSAWAGE